MRKRFCKFPDLKPHIIQESHVKAWLSHRAQTARPSPRFPDLSASLLMGSPHALLSLRHRGKHLTPRCDTSTPLILSSQSARRVFTSEETVPGFYLHAAHSHYCLPNLRRQGPASGHGKPLLLHLKVHVRLASASIATDQHPSLRSTPYFRCLVSLITSKDR